MESSLAQLLSFSQGNILPITNDDIMLQNVNSAILYNSNANDTLIVKNVYCMIGLIIMARAITQ